MVTRKHGLFDKSPLIHASHSIEIFKLLGKPSEEVSHISNLIVMFTSVFRIIVDKIIITEANFRRNSKEEKNYYKITNSIIS